MSTSSRQGYQREVADAQTGMEWAAAMQEVGRAAERAAIAVEEKGADLFTEVSSEEVEKAEDRAVAVLLRERRAKGGVPGRKPPTQSCAMKHGLQCGG